MKNNSENLMHFVLTRFNERYPEIKNNLCLNKEWLQTKIQTFKTITIPSIESQTDQDFYWIVKFHKDTPNWVREELRHPKITSDFSFCEETENTITNCRMFDAIYFSKHPCNLVICKWYFIRKIKEMITTATEQLVTTSLDSDDALSKNHIRIVKEKIQPRCFFDFENGIARIVNKDSTIFTKYKTDKNVSPCYSFCEPIEKHKRILTVYHIPHHYVGQKCIRVNETGWIQTYDQTNLINRAKDIKNALPVLSKDVEKFPHVRF